MSAGHVIMQPAGLYTLEGMLPWCLQMQQDHIWSLLQLLVPLLSLLTYSWYLMDYVSTYLYIQATWHMKGELALL